MPFAFDIPNREVSPDIHDAEAVPAGSTETDVDLILAALSDFAAPSGLLLDIGCGTGRHARSLAARGHTGVGIDIDERMVAAAAHEQPAGWEFRLADAADCDLGQSFAAALLTNKSLVCFHSHRQAWGLFQTVSAHLVPGGLFLIDNPCRFLWDQINEGLLATGMSSDGKEQLFFLPGENRFVWRRDEAVDLESWSPRPVDRLYRAWSLNEIALAAAGAGLDPLDLQADTPILTLAKAEV